jgi:hypothetical protein
MLADIVVNFMIGGLLIWRLIIKGFIRKINFRNFFNLEKKNQFFQIFFELILEVDILKNNCQKHLRLEVPPYLSPHKNNNIKILEPNIVIGVARV